MSDVPPTSSGSAGAAPTQGHGFPHAPSADQEPQVAPAALDVCILPLEEWPRLARAWAGYLFAELFVNNRAYTWRN